jgi:hypothetical protein
LSDAKVEDDTEAGPIIYGDEAGWIDVPGYVRDVLDTDRLFFQFWKPKTYREHLQMKIVDGETYYKWVCPERGIGHSG